MIIICKSCGYDLAGLTDGQLVKCPECGKDYDPSLLHPFPGAKAILVATSIDWLRGLAVMISLSFVFALLSKWVHAIVIAPAILITIAGIFVIGVKSQNKTTRITDYSFSVPKCAWALYTVPTLIWCGVYWTAVLIPWLIVF